MIKVISLWTLPAELTEDEFETWYREKHIGDAKRIRGLREYTINKVVNEEKANSPYYRMAELSFDNLAAAREAFASNEWKDAYADAKDKLGSPIRLFLHTEKVPL